jgi:hypothetical protein
VEKPKTPEQTVKVEFRVTKDRAALIETAKLKVVSTVTTTSDGGTIAEKRPLTFRLQLTPRKE